MMALHDTIEEVEAKLNDLIAEEKGSKLRIESLETWTNKQDEIIQCMNRKLDKAQNTDLEMLKEKIANLEKMEDGIANIKKKCTVCNQLFSLNCDLENHMDVEHKAEKEFQCNVCGKEFFLEWRHKMHLKIHTEKNIKSCKYF